MKLNTRLFLLILVVLLSSYSCYAVDVAYSDDDELTQIVEGVWNTLPECFQIDCKVEITNAEYLNLWYLDISEKSQNYMFNKLLGENSILGENRDGLIVLSTHMDLDECSFTFLHELGHTLGEGVVFSESTINAISSLAQYSPLNNSGHISTNSEAVADSFAWYISSPNTLNVYASEAYLYWCNYEKLS